jgi:hypothetical protein
VLLRHRERASLGGPVVTTTVTRAVAQIIVWQ